MSAQESGRCDGTVANLWILKVSVDIIQCWPSPCPQVEKTHTRAHTRKHKHTVWDEELDPQSEAVHPTLLSWPRLYNYTSLLSHSRRLSCFSSIVDIISFRLYLPLFALTSFPRIHRCCPRLHPSSPPSLPSNSLPSCGGQSPQTLHFPKRITSENNIKAQKCYWLNLLWASKVTVTLFLSTVRSFS